MHGYGFGPWDEDVRWEILEDAGSIAYQMQTPTGLQSREQLDCLMGKR
jgi:hypothetical protein